MKITERPDEVNRGRANERTAAIFDTFNSGKAVEFDNEKEATNAYRVANWTARYRRCAFKVVKRGLRVFAVAAVKE